MSSRMKPAMAAEKDLSGRSTLLFRFFLSLLLGDLFSESSTDASRAGRETPRVPIEASCSDDGLELSDTSHKGNGRETNPATPSRVVSSPLKVRSRSTLSDRDFPKERRGCGSVTSLRQVAKRVLPPKLVDWIRKRKGLALNKARRKESSLALQREPGRSVEHVVGLEVRLWSTGKSIYAHRLARATHLMPAGTQARARGSIALARWDFSHGRSRLALGHIEDVRTSDPGLQAELDLLRVDCLCELGQGQAALTVLSRMAGRSTTDQNVLLRLGYARSLLEEARHHGSGPMAEALNVVYNGAGFGMIRRASVNQPVSLDNIACEVAPAEPREGLPLVTVITWLPESSPVRYWGLSSLVNQSWGNLEIMVLGETDGRDQLSREHGPLLDDPRITFIGCGIDNDRPWLPGIDRAAGAFITTHPPESWAHPQRIEAQARALLAEPWMRAMVSCHTNVDHDLGPRPIGLAPRPGLVGPNPHSTMVRSSGLGPVEVIAAFERVAEAHSPVSGELAPAEEVGLVSSDVPLTLSLSDARHAKTAIETVPG